MIKIFPVLGILLFFFSGLQLTAQEQPEAIPYIYYYDTVQRAFIIERADGEDRYIIGEGLIPPPHDNLEYVVDGPGWSPSGEWFAWNMQQTSGPGGSYARHPYVIQADNNAPLRLIDSLEDASMAWSPHEDLLLVGTYHKNAAQNHLRRYAALINLKTGEAHEAANETLPYETDPSSVEIYPAAYWIRGGDYGVVGWYERNEQYYTWVINLFQPDGSFTQRRLTEFREDTEQDYYLYGCGLISESGKLGYGTKDGFAIEDLISGEIQRFDLDTSSGILPCRWSEDGEHAFVWNDQEGAKEFWLYTGEDLITLSKEVTPDWGAYTVPSWSPDGRHALFWDGLETVYHIDVEQGSLDAMPGTVRDPDLYWYWLDGHTAAVRFRSLRPSEQETEQRIYVFDFESDTTMQISLPETIVDDFHFSPDMTQLAYVVDGVMLYDLDSETYQNIRPSYYSYNDLAYGQIEWHPEGEWLFVFETSASEGRRDMGIMRADGSQRRDLTRRASPRRIALDWLPPQVDLSNLESQRPNPSPTPV